MASSIASGQDSYQQSSKGAGETMIRNRAFANQESLFTDNAKLPLYFVNTSCGLVASNPNTMRDMGRVRNCVYKLDGDATD